MAHRATVASRAVVSPLTVRLPSPPAHHFPSHHSPNRPGIRASPAPVCLEDVWGHLWHLLPHLSVLHSCHLSKALLPDHPTQNCLLAPALSFTLTAPRPSVAHVT